MERETLPVAERLEVAARTIEAAELRLTRVLEALEGAARNSGYRLRSGPSHEALHTAKLLALATEATQAEAARNAAVALRDALTAELGEVA